jgi:hypothetical protein
MCDAHDKQGRGGGFHEKTFFPFRKDESRVAGAAYARNSYYVTRLKGTERGLYRQAVPRESVPGTYHCVGLWAHRCFYVGDQV